MQKIAICIAVALVAITPPTTTLAQVNTDCHWFGTTWSCESRDPNADAEAWGALLGTIARTNKENAERQAAAEAERARVAQEQRQQEQTYAQERAQISAQQQEQDFLTIISQAIQNRECEDAKSIALSWNRLDIADQSMRLCKPKTGKINTDSKKYNSNGVIFVCTNKNESRQCERLIEKTHDNKYISSNDERPNVEMGESLYLYGLNLWESKDYDGAEAKITEFIGKFPNHPRQSYAVNLLGRIHLDKGQSVTAAKIFLDNYRVNPKGDRAADSLYFLGVSLITLNKLSDACTSFDELQQVYKTSMRDFIKERLPLARKAAHCN